ncbi:DUF1232 domain-containing protein [Aquabacterium soli]|jgi:uncharacterized membrane protein YkvA (DUF1232 family)|uniref:DUF1232 domain-containing protein n=1 Tax=Aquabacterium soli TaxID=2493092 RepID=A0A3R8T1X6_9BURK|nr:DUF1232 domain-containing protein [Aquabacterium soli]RRS04298.1 DUF1232 domain-containing protein [Aquabacterium soli]
MWKRLSMLWLLLKGDARRLWFALRHPQSPGWLKLGTGLMLLYMISPIDIVPDWIPLLGVVDDVVVLSTAMRLMLNRLPAAVRADVDRRMG